MAGRGGSRSFGVKFMDKVADVATWLTKDSGDGPQVIEIGSCPQCHQPLLTTCNGCSSCQGFKVYPGKCKLPGCDKPCYFDQHSKRVHDFCGRTHATQYKNSFQSGTSGHRHSHGGHHGSRYGGSVYGNYSHNQYSQGNYNYQYQHGYNTRAATSYYGSGPIHFYNRDEPYYEFTNFYEGHQPIVLDNEQWRTSEHYFQAQKFVGTPYVEWIRRLDRPREAFDLSRNPSVSRWRRSDWEQVKVEVMHKVLLAKFTQSDYLKQLLLSTGDRKLVEHTHRDSFWGDGGDGSGLNHLGRLLMQVREEIREGSGGKESSVDNHELVRQSWGNANTSRLRTDSGGANSSPPPSRDGQQGESSRENDPREASGSEDDPIDSTNEAEELKKESKKDPPVGNLIEFDAMDTTESTTELPNPSFPKHMETSPSSSAMQAGSHGEQQLSRMPIRAQTGPQGKMQATPHSGQQVMQTDHELEMGQQGGAQNQSRQPGHGYQQQVHGGPQNQFGGQQLQGGPQNQFGGQQVHDGPQNQFGGQQVQGGSQNPQFGGQQTHGGPQNQFAQQSVSQIVQHGMQSNVVPTEQQAEQLSAQGGEQKSYI